VGQGPDPVDPALLDVADRQAGAVALADLADQRARAVEVGIGGGVDVAVLRRSTGTVDHRGHFHRHRLQAVLGVVAVADPHQGLGLGRGGGAGNQTGDLDILDVVGAGEVVEGDGLAGLVGDGGDLSPGGVVVVGEGVAVGVGEGLDITGGVVVLDLSGTALDVLVAGPLDFDQVVGAGAVLALPRAGAAVEGGDPGEDLGVAIGGFAGDRTVAAADLGQVEPALKGELPLVAVVGDGGAIDGGLAQAVVGPHQGVAQADGGDEVVLALEDQVSGRRI